MVTSSNSTDQAVRSVPYALPYLADEEIAGVVAALRSGWITTGPQVKEFEQRFARHVKAPQAIALNSCTAALHLALLGAGVGPGDEVITTPLTFCATVNTILHVGARPVLADVDPRTLCLSPDAAAAKITPRTKALLPVHYAGCPADMAAFLHLAQEHRLAVIEDAAHAIGTEYNNQPIGALGDFTCFSFYATKNLTTGEGGMLTGKDESTTERLRKLALHGMSRDAWQRYSLAGSWAYQVEMAGFKYNMTDLAAALGLAQLERFAWLQQIREGYVARYQSAFAESGFELPPQSPRPGDRHSWHLYILRLDPCQLTIERGDFIKQLQAVGIGTSVHFIPIHLHPYYQQELGVRPGDFPVTERAYSRMLSLPLYPKLSEEDVSYVIAQVTHLAQRYRK
ncbi:MAG: DegT/DnrJ/EryC1/StrS family aminotransferase [Cyanobacteria bacterium NC_groundwater_1444_Ag_S-0.65um_54_12]|nr:DegT/DnrJ/EryC1/StrS family aminotransferase [Cyanobacteria bacterium NC_groundwater_1444_Ag_S-0.65um_54_12]